MSVEVMPVGYACQLACRYCYQEPIRCAGNAASRVDVNAMKRALVTENQEFTVFGGEALLAPIDVLEELWSFGFQEYGRNGIQTNGALIAEEHIALFQRYRVHVGFSIDGPDELNDARKPRDGGDVRQSTAKSVFNLKHLLALAHPCSLIVTLHQGNASADRLPRLKKWLRELDSLGLRSSRLHLLQEGKELALTQQENINALLDLAGLERELENLRFDKFKEIVRLLQGHDEKATCIWNACDPWTTRAVRGVLSNGTCTNCGRVNDEGIAWVKAHQPGTERCLALYATPQEHGGCKWCRFFLLCKGNCPGTAIDGDWRNRTEYCGVYQALFAHFERQLMDLGIQPITRRPDLEYLESLMLEAWCAGQRSTVQALVAKADRRDQNRAAS